MSEVARRIPLDGASGRGAARLVRLPPAEPYPERKDRDPSFFDALEAHVTYPLTRLSGGLRRRRLFATVAAINRLGPKLAALEDARIRALSAELRVELLRRGLVPDLVVRSFALVREVASRSLGLRHYDVQLAGGLALLAGRIAEMDTGEGKTLTATLAAATAALAGIPVHVITVNDYLAHRDASTMQPIFRALGLSVGIVQQGLDAEARRQAYGADITYAANNEIAFDYLRDKIALAGATSTITRKFNAVFHRDHGRPREVMRGLHFAIVDEADSVLIDEARTPLIISRETDRAEERAWAEAAFRLIEPLEGGLDYQVLHEAQRIALSDAGRTKLQEQAETLGGPWASRIRREEAARQALAAQLLFRADEHYLVRDGRIEIVDPHTGRRVAERSWNAGIHQLIEVKEGCEVTGRKLPIARISYQRLFRRYRRVAGMTGTAREVASELWQVYRLAVLSVPPNRPARRRRLPGAICVSKAEKYRTIVARIAVLHEAGRPVLIGTHTVAESQTISSHLAAAGLPHQVLSAAQDENEAKVIARAGGQGQITVATNMAGRGVDIRLDEPALHGGGLHVILSERQESSRIDRQLFGRCGRQGEPGSYEEIVSLEDSLLRDFGHKTVLSLAEMARPVWPRLAALALDRAQRKAEKVHSQMRRDLLKMDVQIETMLGYAGRRQ